LKKNYSTFYPTIIMILFAILFASCSGGEDGATQAIESYIHALGNKDSVQISNYSCADWEQNALIEVDSLTAVGSKVENLECKQSGQESENVFVTCTGLLALDYDGEAQQIDLSTRTYIALQEGGEWRMCGYK